MTVRTLAAALAATLVGGASVTASGAAAQKIFYEDGDYFYAVPADTVVTQTVETQAPTTAVVVPMPDMAQPVFTYDPVVQPIGEAVVEDTVVESSVVENTAPRGAVRSIPARPVDETYNSPAYSGPVYQGTYAYATAPRSGYLPGGGQLVSFDREVWLAECRTRIGTYEDSDRARLIATLAGAAAGGFIGNRVAGSGNRLGGTLIGAGTGALAGSIVGDAIDDRSDSRRYQAGYGDDGGYCAAYLDDYLARASQTAASTTTTVPGQQYFLVPVTVEVAQQPVYSD